MSVGWLDFFGHIFYALLFMGMIALAWKKPIGWVLRFIGELGWLFVGIGLGLSSVIVWDSIFLVCEVYGLYQWKKNP